MELTEYRLGDIAKVVNGSTPSTLHPEYYDGDVVWITPKDLSEQKSKYIQKGERNITTEGYNSCSTQMIPANNILLTSRAPIGLVAINSVECCTNQGFKNIIVDNSKADVDYLYYYIKYHIKEIEILGAGTTFKEVSKNALEKYIISIPSLSSQRKIAGVLSALDQKIALNRTINQSLEQLAKTIYTYYFLQFHNAKVLTYNPTLKKMLPTGWEVKTLFDTVDVLYGFPFNSAFFTEQITDTPVVRIRDIADKSTSTYTTEPISNKYKLQKGDVLIGMDGNFHMCIWGNENAYINQRCVRLRPLADSPISSYQILFSLLPYIKAKESSIKGSTVGHLSDKDLKELYLLQPTLEEMDLKEQLNSILDGVANNQTEITALTTYRDALLPVLMNGQVEVE